MDEQFSRLVIDEIKGIRLYCYFYLTVVFIWCYFKPSSTNYEVICSWLYVFAILISTYYIRRDFLDGRRIKNYCISIGVIIALWSASALYSEYNLNIFFVFALSFLVPAFLFKRYVYSKRTPRECLLFFIGYYLILFFATFVLFQTLFPLYLFLAICTVLFLSDSWKILHGETTSSPYRFWAMAIRQLLFRKAEIFLMVVFAADALNSFSEPIQQNFSPIMPLFILLYVIFNSEILILMLLKKIRK